MNKKIGFLTSSRADFGIQTPLIEQMSKDDRYEITIIVFGTHLELAFGNTIDEILIFKDIQISKIKYMPTNDDPYSISLGFGVVIKKFALFWSQSTFDLVFAIGDRYEMCAALQASIPFGIKAAHIHGGETSMGAIDNIYRDQLTRMAHIHLVSCKSHASRVKNISDNDKYIFNVGALSLYGLKNLKLPAWGTVCKNLSLPDAPFVLITFHPETVNYNNNSFYLTVIEKVLTELSLNINLLVTGSNADTFGLGYKKLMKRLNRTFPDRIFFTESLGKLKYFSALKEASFLLGNSSSALIESASFGKYCINVGDRQKGRKRNNNIIDVPYNMEEIVNKCLSLINREPYLGENVFQGSIPLEKVPSEIYNILN